MGEFFFYVDLPLVGGDQPRLDGAKAGVFAVVPVHWRPGVVTGLAVNDGEGLLFGVAFLN